MFSALADYLYSFQMQAGADGFSVVLGETPLYENQLRFDAAQCRQLLVWNWFVILINDFRLFVSIPLKFCLERVVFELCPWCWLYGAAIGIDLF